jgi:hypothetical protein
MRNISLAVLIFPIINWSNNTRKRTYVTILLIMIHSPFWVNLLTFINLSKVKKHKVVSGLNYLIKLPAMKNYSSSILDLGIGWTWVETSRPDCYTAVETVPRTHWTGGWVGPKIVYKFVYRYKLYFFHSGLHTIFHSRIFYREEQSDTWYLIWTFYFIFVARALL